MRLSGLKAKGLVPHSPTEGLVLLPALALGAYWLAGEGALVALALSVPVLWIVAGSVRRTPPVALIRGFGGEADLLAHLDPILSDMAVKGQTTACLVVAFDEPERQFDRLPPGMRDTVIERTAERLSVVVRPGDLVVRLADGAIAIGLGPVRRFDLETAIQLSGRLRAAALVPIAESGMTLHPSVSVGFCIADRAPAPVGRSLLEAARIAADEALHNGPGAIRSFLPDMSRRRADRIELRDGLERALDQGEIRPWFQPQIAVETGEISGFEALARWHHPEKGILPPAEFLPLIEDSGLSERLGDVILYGALSAITRWDQAGFAIPRVSINLSGAQLRSPALAERLNWEVDRFGLTPARLTVEVLESVAGKPGDEMIVANLKEIARRGFGIDLDDFGTGQAAIGNIRRFSIRRVKIDRSFVTGADTDPEQRRLLGAILGLCGNLGVETVAEGVETPGETDALVQLGCTHLQGFGIARPMAMEETFGWIRRHRPLADLDAADRQGRAPN